MQRTAFALALVGSLTLGMAPAAIAAPTKLSADQAEALCTRLSDQFMSLKPFKQGLPYWQEAQAEFAAGKSDCADGQPVKGAQAMQSAISDLYVKPDTL